MVDSRFGSGFGRRVVLGARLDPLSDDGTSPALNADMPNGIVGVIAPVMKRSTRLSSGAIGGAEKEREHDQTTRDNRQAAH